MVKMDFLELSAAEKKNKALYLADRDSTLFSPVCFEDLNRIASTQKQHEDLRSFYMETSSDHKGLTIARNSLYERTEVYVSTHPRYSYPVLHNHEFLELIYVMSGSCINYIEGKAIAMKAGDLCFMAPSTVHTLLAVNDNDIIFNILLWEESFSNAFPKILNRGDIIATFFKNMSLATNPIPYLLFRTQDNSLISQNVLEVYTEFSNKEHCYLEMIALKINEIAIELSRNFSDKVEYGEPLIEKTDAYIYPILSLIQMNYKTISLKELAGIFSYSETYLSKLIKKKTGKTFKDIVEEARITEAKSLVLNTEYTMTEISQKAGYFDSSHMNRDFIKWLGMPPKKWSQQNKTSL